MPDMAMAKCVKSVPKGGTEKESLEKTVKSGSLVALFVCAMLLIVLSGAFKPAVDMSSLTPTERDAMRTGNLKSSLIAVCASYLLYSALQGPNTHMVRPHPAVWKVMHGLFVLYLLFLVFLLCQETGDARMVLKFLSSDLGVELPERAYGEDCRIYTPEDPESKFRVLRDTVFDEFFVGHILGWYGKAIALRNLPLLWAYSVTFFGISLGMMTVRFFEGRFYDWMGTKDSKGLSGKVRQGLQLFTPATWDSYIWNPTSSPLRFTQCAFVVLVCLVFELNAFFLKFVLWIPPPHLLNHIRLALWFGISNVSTSEYYVFITSKEGMHLTKMGANAWLVVAAMIIEILVVLKHGRGMFEAPWPKRVLWFWGAFATIIGVWLTRWHLRTRGAVKAKKP
jgi:phosphatidylserine synthase 2